MAKTRRTTGGFGRRPAVPGKEPANRIREIREGHGLSVDAVAARIGPQVEGSTISKLENRKMRLTLEWMYRLADALGVQWWELGPNAPPPISAEDAELLDAYRGLAEPDRDTARRIIDALRFRRGE